MQNNIVPILTETAHLKRSIRKELKTLGFKQEDGQLLPPELISKQTIRETHRPQKQNLLRKNFDFIETKSEALIDFFADGTDVVPCNIELQLELIKPYTWQSDLFRLASLSWSVPVSNGFGRRLRYLVWDKANGKLAGIIALGDPVYNSRAREKEVGWSLESKKNRLVNLLDAYVLGAVPPYNQLLIGKVIACMIRSKEVVEDFRKKYGSSIGIISNEAKNAELVAVTTSSSMGRSSVYNRLRLGEQWYFRQIGYSEGWGHFHISDELFTRLRAFLRSKDHGYADHNRFGNGPNWKMRTIRAAMELLGFDPNVLRHGIKREIFICSIADNAYEVLNTPCNLHASAAWNTLQSTNEISMLGVERWVMPRSIRRAEYGNYNKKSLINLLRPNSEILVSSDIDGKRSKL